MPAISNEEPSWAAVLNRNAGFDQRFVYAVVSTGVYCRPSCPSRRPSRKNVRFFGHWRQAEQAGFRACRRCRPNESVKNPRALEMCRTVCCYIDKHLDEPLTLEALSKQAGVSRFHLQRVFRSVVGMSPREYVDACRISSLKDRLRSGQAVTRALYDAGYGSSSRLYERSDSLLGMTPATYGRRGLGAHIRYTVVDSPLGFILIASTERGVCSIQFGSSEAELERALADEYARAVLERTGQELLPEISELLRHLSGEQPALHLPLDLRATAFQRRVWAHLRSIPYGSTQSYGQVAEAIGQPTAARAVARACASNPVAVAIPCHRVIREDGQPGGYRWGLERKKRLLAWEQAQ